MRMGRQQRAFIAPKRVTAVFLLLFLVRRISAQTTTTTCSANDDEETSSSGSCVSSSSSSPSSSCGLYVAESTIPGAGVGIFTATERSVGETVGYGDLCIPIVDYYWHNKYSSKYGNPFKDYLWQGTAMGMNRETARNDIEALCVGLDCAINCHLALVNVDKRTPLYDDGSLGTMSKNNNKIHRDDSPGAGAFTPYHNATTTVSRAIPAGGELFKHYGDAWFSMRERAFGKIPLTDDYRKAEAILGNFKELKVVKQYLADKEAEKEDSSSLSSPAGDAVIKDLYENVISKMKHGAVKKSRTLNALPDDLENALTAAEKGELAAVIQPHHTRDVDWLRQHGACLDNIIPGPSTIDQAGFGAFASRDLPAGTVITVSPLIHIPSYTILNMYNFTRKDDYDENDDDDDDDDDETDDTKWYRLVDEIKQMQLIYNYCYGDDDSDVLLCPYGAGVSYINHNRRRRNVELQWAENFSIVHNKTLVERGTIADLAASSKPQLAFQYVATKDVKAGDELFLDYGDAWVEAWLEHVDEYEAPPTSSSSQKYASAQFWNYHFASVAVRTQKEQTYDPYPNNLELRCHRALVSQKVNPVAVYVWQKKDYGLSCRILNRFIEDGAELYTVLMEYRGDHGNDSSDSADNTVTQITRTDVPRSAIRFFDLPYTTDVHLSTAFRHEIGVPFDIFPAQWRES